jgi:hypothetical protein
MLEEHVNATLTLPIEDQPAEFMGGQGPVLTVVVADVSYSVSVCGTPVPTIYAAGGTQPR